MPVALSFDPLLPLLSVQVRLRLTRPVRLHFLHGGVLHGLLCQALGHELPHGLVPFAPESGRVRFEAGDGYSFGLTFPAALAVTLAGLEEGLRRVGRMGSRPLDGGKSDGARTEGPLVSLGGNFEVESVETIGVFDGAALAQATEAVLAQAARPEGLTLRWLSPLRLERPPGLRAPGAGYLNGDCFLAELFLERLALRLAQLATGSFPAREELPAVPETVRAEPELLTWVDLPLTGRPEARPAGPARGGNSRGRMTLGGVLGSVRFHGLEGEEARPWADALALGRLLHAGQSSRYGLGRYALEGVLPADDEPLRPARALLEDPAAVRQLTAAADTLLEDCGWAYRLGLNRASTARTLEAAQREGWSLEPGADLAALYSLVEPCRLLRRLRALYPLDPLAEALKPVLRASALLGRGDCPSAGGLPSGLPLSEALARFGIEELAEAVRRTGRRLVRVGGGYGVVERVSK